MSVFLSQHLWNGVTMELEIPINLVGRPFVRLNRPIKTELIKTEFRNPMVVSVGGLP